MDDRFRSALQEGIDSLGLSARVPAEARELLERFADRLLLWNRKVNLTAITESVEVAEKHLVDSLALLPDLDGMRSLLDIGSGAGIPAVPIACVARTLDVVCCESVAKKVAFVKAVSAELDVRVRAVAVRADGSPTAEGLPLCDAVVSRALADPERWLPLGRNYVAPGGRLLAMLGRLEGDEGLREAGERAGLRLVSVRRLLLPRSRSERAIATFVVD